VGVRPILATNDQGSIGLLLADKLLGTPDVPKELPTPDNLGSNPRQFRLSTRCTAHTRSPLFIRCAAALARASAAEAP